MDHHDLDRINADLKKARQHQRKAILYSRISIVFAVLAIGTVIGNMLLRLWPH